MIWPPSILRILIAADGARKISLWIPLFLFWPLLILAAMVFPVVLMCAPELRRRMKHTSAFAVGPMILHAFAAMRGTTVRVGDEGNQIYIAFW